MDRKILKMLIWKEWRETWKRAMVLLLTFLVPIIYLTSEKLFSRKPGLTFWLLRTNLKGWFGLILFYQLLFLMTVGLLVIALFASRTLVSEIENHRIFFLLERPIKRREILIMKFLVGVCQVVVASGISFLVAEFAIRFLIHWEKSDSFHKCLLDIYLVPQLLMYAFILTVMVGTVGVAVFSAALMCSLLFPKWWVGETVGILAFILLFHFTNWNVLGWFVVPGKIGLRRAVVPFPHLKPSISLVCLGLTILFYAATHFLFQRKELK